MIVEESRQRFIEYLHEAAASRKSGLENMQAMKAQVAQMKALLSAKSPG